MILADTSVWIDHLRGKTKILTDYLLDDSVIVVTHEMVIGELALGGLKKESESYQRIESMRKLSLVTSDELSELIEKRQLVGTGIGYVDASLLASCLISGARLLTLDTKLAKVAAVCGVGSETEDG
jgi:predicted nucleic acid-binding protein